MTDSLEEASRWMTGLEPRQRARAFVVLGHELTIASRVLAHSAAPESDRVEQLRQLNEIQHRVIGYLIHALGTDEDVGWIRPVLAYVFTAEDPQVRRLAVYCWDRTVAQPLKPSV